MTNAQSGPGWANPDAVNPDVAVPSQAVPAPYSAVPYSGVPTPYSAVPYSGVPAPYSAVPYSGVPAPYSAIPGQPGPAGYGPTYPGYPLPVWTPPPPKPKITHSPLGWAIVVVCVLSIAVSGLVGLGQLVGDGVGAVWHAAEVDSPPATNAPAAEWNAWARRAVDEAVKQQAAALVAGDEQRFLADVDPAATLLVDQLHREFQVLHQMGIGRWTQATRAVPTVTGEKTWHADIKQSYCFGDASCRPNTLVYGTEWQLADNHLMMTDLEASDSDQIGPRPWETGDLVVAAGSRVVVAASQRYERRAAETLAVAEKAAAVADTMARWSGPPSRYVVFLAGPSDWSTWYGYNQPEWAAGVYVNQTDNEVVVNGGVVYASEMQDLLTHELTHVATLAGKRDGVNAGVWWLVEGIADYAPMIGRPVSEYDAISAVRSFVNSRWNGDPAVTSPPFSASTEEAAARYGVAFLSVRRLSEVYGQDKMLEFWGRVVHDDLTLETSSTQTFGLDWASVKADCAQYIRSVAG